MTAAPKTLRQKERFRTAKAAYDDSRFAEAAAVLGSLYEEGARWPALFALLGVSLKEAGRLADAAAVFAKATTLVPKCEWLSLGLFHCLLQLGEDDAAFDESKRFVASNPAEEYMRLVREFEAEADA